MTFWQRINKALDRIESEKPTTFDEVKAILDADGDPDRDGNPGNDSAFFGGSGGDRQLRPALNVAGWRTTWMQASYYYRMVSPTGEHIEYVEGDVYRAPAAAVDA